MIKPSKFPASSDYYHACLSKVILPMDYAKRLSDWTNDPKDFLLYLGSPGVGKTYFCAALQNLRSDEKKSCYYINERDFFSGLRDCISNNWDYNLEIEKFSQQPFIIFDDLGSSRTELTDWQKEALFILIDNRSMNRLPTIITSNLYLSNIKEKFEPRFHSRLAAARNTILQLKEDDLRQRTA